MQRIAVRREFHFKVQSVGNKRLLPNRTTISSRRCLPKEWVGDCVGRKWMKHLGGYALAKSLMVAAMGRPMTLKKSPSMRGIQRAG
jgi:hypothetical protein